MVGRSFGDRKGKFDRSRRKESLYKYAENDRLCSRVGGVSSTERSC